MQRTPECTRCGKRKWIKPWDRLPAMFGLEYEDGTVINLCQKCMCELGRLRSKKEQDEFLEKLKNVARGDEECSG